MLMNGLRFTPCSAAVFAACIVAAGGSAAFSQKDPPVAKKKEAVVSLRATGTFDVKLAPLALDDKAADPTMARMSIDKKFLGGLDAVSKGEMLSAGTAVKGSAGYVAIERVSGTLDGKTGSFVFQHSGTMTRGEPQLSVTVVPDSGTGQLVGLTGKMTIKIEDKKHSYEFEYTLPDKQ